METIAASEAPASPLSRRYLVAALIIAAALPAILLATVIILLISGNYNFLEWME